MNWINCDEYKLMNKFFNDRELEFREKYGFSHDSVGDFFKLKYISTIGDKKTIFYSINNEETKLYGVKKQ